MQHFNLFSITVMKCQNIFIYIRDQFDSPAQNPLQIQSTLTNKGEGREKNRHHQHTVTIRQMYKTQTKLPNTNTPLHRQDTNTLSHSVKPFKCFCIFNIQNWTHYSLRRAVESYQGRKGRIMQRGSVETLLSRERLHSLPSL